jgi:hypothetical protein
LGLTKIVALTVSKRKILLYLVWYGQGDNLCQAQIKAEVRPVSKMVQKIVIFF